VARGRRLAARQGSARQWTTLQLRANYAASLYDDTHATLDDLREAEATYEEIKRTARRVFGSEHPLTTGIEKNLKVVRGYIKLNARETPSSPGTA
jgi:hypothetical protein